jgi:hypothetical protein
MRRLGRLTGDRQVTWIWGTLFFWVAITSFVLHFTRPVAAVGHMPQLVLQLRNARNPAAVPLDSVLVFQPCAPSSDVVSAAVN